MSLLYVFLYFVHYLYICQTIDFLTTLDSQPYVHCHLTNYLLLLCLVQNIQLGCSTLCFFGFSASHVISICASHCHCHYTISNLSVCQYDVTFLHHYSGYLYYRLCNRTKILGCNVLLDSVIIRLLTYNNNRL